MKHCKNTSINLFFNRNFSDDYFFNRIYFDNENDIVKSLIFLKRFLNLEGISGYLHLKNDANYLRKQFIKSKFIYVDSIYTLESPTELITPTSTSIDLDKEISVTKITDTVLLNKWTNIFCRSFNIKDCCPFMEIVNENKQKFVFLLAMLKNKNKKENKNENHDIHNGGIDNDNIPVGVCLLFEKYGCLGLYCLGTLPEFRSRGIAKMIVKTSLQIAYTMKYDKIFLQTFQNDNYIDFYKKFKFKVIDKRKIFQIN